MRKCIKCNKEKLEDEFYANWSHWCNECIDKRKRENERGEKNKNSKRNLFKYKRK